MDAAHLVLLSASLLRLLLLLPEAAAPAFPPSPFLHRLGWAHRTGGRDGSLLPPSSSSSSVVDREPAGVALCPMCAAEGAFLLLRRGGGGRQRPPPGAVRSTDVQGTYSEESNVSGGVQEASDAARDVQGGPSAASAARETSNAVRETLDATGAAPEIFNAASASNATSGVLQTFNVTSAANETSNATTSVQRTSNTTSAAHRTSNATGSVQETSSITSAANETSNATGSVQQTPNITRAAHETSIADPSLTEQDLWHRLELIKTQILSKIQLKEGPKGQLPKAIGRRVLPLMLASQPPTAAPTPTPDTQTSILLSTRRASCGGRGPGDCFLFTLKEPASRGASANARLWFWKLEDPGDALSPHTLAVAEVRSRSGHYRTLLAQTRTSEKAGWVEVDLSGPFGSWLARGRRRVQVEISCPSCRGGRPPVSHLQEHRPFVVLTTRQPQVRRRRSSRECSSLWGGGCCRKTLNVSVSEMGWDDWLLHPQVFTFYYCHGTCSPSVASATAPGVSRYSNLLQTLMLRQPVHSSLREALTPCCAPTSYSDMPLIQRGDNDTVALIRIPDLLVDSCGCND